MMSKISTETSSKKEKFSPLVQSSILVQYSSPVNGYTRFSTMYIKEKVVRCCVVLLFLAIIYVIYHARMI